MRGKEGVSEEGREGREGRVGDREDRGEGYTQNNVAGKKSQ